MSKFKVGDKVRLIQRDTVHTIIRVVNESSGLYKLSDGFETWGGQYLELVASADPKREFLERLQLLLREFDAGIEFWYDYIDQTCGTIIKVGDTEINKNEVYGITPDNIMDFDKK